MIRLTAIELYKLFLRPRSYIGFAALLVIVSFTHIAIYLEGAELLDFLTQNLKEVFQFQGNLINGYLVSYIVFNFLWVHIPLLVVLVTGDLFSGEAHSGTLRIVLTRPVSRIALASAKFMAGWIYTALLVSFLGVITLPSGLMIFGKGDLILLLDDLHIVPSGILTYRFLAASIFGMISMLTIASLSLMLSSFSRNSIGPILLTMAVIIVFTLFSSVELGVFNRMRPFLFTSYLNSWQYLFKLQPDYSELLQNAVVLLAHTLVFYFITIISFRKKNILS